MTGCRSCWQQHACSQCLGRMLSHRLGHFLPHSHPILYQHAQLSSTQPLTTHAHITVPAACIGGGSTQPTSSHLRLHLPAQGQPVTPRVTRLHSLHPPPQATPQHHFECFFAQPRTHTNTDTTTIIHAGKNSPSDAQPWLDWLQATLPHHTAVRTPTVLPNTALT